MPASSGSDPQRSASASTIRIDVHDGATDPARVPDVAPEVGGRGLRIVEALAERWGSDPLDAGKVVWAELPCRR